MTSNIEKSIDLAASPSRVWRALTDATEFGAWFRVAIEGKFAVGEEARGHITYSGYEHLPWAVRVVAIEPETRFAFTWHPYAVDPDKDYSGEAPTLVEFHLAPLGDGTRLTVVESGFERIPAERRDEAVRMNEGGWAEQARNIAAHVDG